MEGKVLLLLGNIRSVLYAVQDRFLRIYIVSGYKYMVPPPPQELPTLDLLVPESQDSVSLKDYRYQSHISRERVSQLIQVRREHAVNDNTALFHVGST